jgi:hypothetical protein
MLNVHFSGILDQFLQKKAKKLIDYLPAQTGIFRIVYIGEPLYKMSFVSLGGGGYKSAEEAGNWYGSDWDTCYAETRSSGECVYEVLMLNFSVPVINAYKLPESLQQSIYEDRDLPEGSHIKSQLVTTLARNYIDTCLSAGVYFPSRRKPGGGALVYDPTKVSTKVMYTGIQPPPLGSLGWPRSFSSIG